MLAEMLAGFERRALVSSAGLGARIDAGRPLNRAASRALGRCLRLVPRDGVYPVDRAIEGHDLSDAAGLG